MWQSCISDFGLRSQGTSIGIFLLGPIQISRRGIFSANVPRGRNGTVRDRSLIEGEWVVSFRVLSFYINVGEYY
jgi:hypothetical protein